MKGFREPTLAERQETAAAARKAQMEKVRAKLPANDPDYAAKQAVKLAESQVREAARREKAAQREAAKQAEAIRLAAEKAEKDALRAAELLAEQEAQRIAAIREKETAAERAAKAEEDATAQKLKRDARYAARRARKR